MTWFIDCRLASCLLVAAMVMTLSPEHWGAILCSLFGVFGGGISNFLTYDERKPTKKYIFGDLLSCGVSGMGVFVTMKTASVDAVFYSILAGAAASGMFLALVSKFKPAWLDRHAGGV
jgi:hypothetical protein